MDAELSIKKDLDAAQHELDALRSARAKHNEVVEALVRQVSIIKVIVIVSSCIIMARCICD